MYKHMYLPARIQHYASVQSMWDRSPVGKFRVALLILKACYFFLRKFGIP